MSMSPMLLYLSYLNYLNILTFSSFTWCCRYSFAIVGINLTSMAYQLLRDGHLKAHFYAVVDSQPQLQDFHLVYGLSPHTITFLMHISFIISSFMIIISCYYC